MRTGCSAAKILISVILSAMPIGAPFRCCMAQESREHGPPLAAEPTVLALNAAPLTPLSRPTLLTLPATTSSVLSLASRGVDLRRALVVRTVTHTLLGAREHYRFTDASIDREERQRRQVAIHLGRAVSQAGDATTALRIEAIYGDLHPAHWGRHVDGLLGGHFNFDYSAVRCADFDRLLPHGRYGSFASLHFHHDQQRVHIDAANPFGVAGMLAPVHFFVDVVAGHLPWLAQSTDSVRPRPARVRSRLPVLGMMAGYGTFHSP